MRDVTTEAMQLGLTEGQISGALAVLCDVPADMIMGYALVVITETGGPAAGLKIITSMGSNRALASQVLRHAAGHLEGTCKRCSRRDRRAIRGSGK